jgi:hypothetical protein
MKIWVAAIVAAILMSVSAGGGVVAGVDPPQFPGTGMPYAEARAMLLRQDLIPAPVEGLLAIPPPIPADTPTRRHAECT